MVRIFPPIAVSAEDRAEWKTFFFGISILCMMVYVLGFLSLLVAICFVIGILTIFVPLYIDISIFQQSMLIIYGIICGIIGTYQGWILFQIVNDVFTGLDHRFTNYLRRQEAVYGRFH